MSFLSTLAQSSNYYDYNYSYDYNSLNSSDGAVATGVLVIFYLIYFLFAIAYYVVQSIFLGKIFKKAGIEAWKAWVPFYNIWIMLELGGQPGFWAVLSIIPFVNIASVIFLFIAQYHIGLKLQKEGVFVLLAIFLPVVWFIWLGVDKSVWQGERRSGIAQGPANQPPVAS